MAEARLSTPWGPASSFLGRGALADVYLLAADEAHPRTAVKVMRKSLLAFLGAVRSVVQEREALDEACGGGGAALGVVELLGAAHSDALVYLRLKAVLATQSTSVRVSDVIQTHQSQLAPAMVAFLIGKLSHALAYLHSRNIAHRDLKPENVVLAPDGAPVLIDFGCSKVLPEGGATFTYCGTKEYMAPEQFSRRGHGCAVDCWALGVMMYLMLLGDTPFEAATANELQASMGAVSTAYEHLGEEAAGGPAGLLSGLLCVDPKDRLSSSDVTQHDWCKQRGEFSLPELVADVAHVMELGRVNPNSDDEEEQILLASERDELIERSDDMWRKNRAKWEGCFSQAFGCMLDCS
ncbi:MAG: hypothetical protein SGPRY_006683 [Prymnesium sp.]